MSKEINCPNCCTELTYVYSSPCIEYFEKLVEALHITFGIEPTKASDMFWYGVFCNPETYAYYNYYDACPCEVPTILGMGGSFNEKLDYIKKTITAVLKGEEERPCWMTYVEDTEAFNEFSDAPSTFLYLIPKKDEYKELGNALFEFLYSPNMLMTIKTGD